MEGKCQPFPKVNIESLSVQQNAAIQHSGENPISVINGPPGVGKTRTAVELLRLTQGQRVVVCAPTGKAASRIAEALGEGGVNLDTLPMTIHRALGWVVSDHDKEGYPRRNAESPFKADLILIDESSMIPLELMASLFDAIEPGTRVVLIGDANQLPPVGPGQPFIDLIASGTIPTTTLQDVWRQAQGSKIWLACQAIMEQSPYDFYRYATRDGDEIAFNALESSERIKQFFKTGLTGFMSQHNGHGGIQILTPVREKGPASAVALNELASHICNPSKATPMALGQAGDGRPGDRVMQIKNNYHRGVFNGDHGEILRVGKEIIKVESKRRGKEYYNWSRWPVPGESGHTWPIAACRIGEKTLPYTEEEAEKELCLSYALTIHRVQGSESPHVAIACPVEAWGMMGRRLLLTAVSRARKRAVLAGPLDVVTKAITTDRDASRRSGLRERLQ